jgi:predicted amidohydrolase
MQRQASPADGLPGSYSTDPADLFTQLYDQLPDGPFRNRQAVNWDRNPQVTQQAEDVRESVLEQGVVSPGLLEKILDGAGHRGVFTVLRGLDWALAHVNPFSPVFDYGRLAPLATRYAETAQLNDPAVTDGALLPRCAYPGRPRGSSSKALFFGVHRVPAETWRQVKYERIKARHEPHFRPDQPVVVGCAPILESFDDLQLEFSEEDGNSVFRLGPVDSQQLRARIDAVIMKLDESGAQIGVMPEGALSDALLAHWKSVGYATAERGKPLRWLLVGSGPLGEIDPPPNRAVLLDRWTGDSLLAQDKLSPFTLTAEQTSDWKLADRPINGAAAEYMTQGSAVSVRESSLGRLAVLICEDLTQSDGWERELLAYGVSHLLVPIFSKPIMQYRWEQTAAERQVNNMGSWVVIANSLVVDRALGNSLPASGRHTCLIAGPGDSSRANYRYNLQFGTAETGDELGRVLLDGVLGLPAVRTAAVNDAWFGNSGRARGT